MNLDEMLVRAKFSIKIRDFEQAIKLLSKIALEQPNVPGLYLLLGNCYQAVKSYNDAINNYELAIKKDPSLIEAHNNLGVISKVQGEYDKALHYFREATRIDPDRADIYYNMGNVYRALGRSAEAISFYKKAIAKNQDYDLPYNNLGIVYQELGRHEEAINAYLHGLQIDPNNIKLHYNLGVLYDKLDEHDSAVEHYQKAIDNNPNYIEAHNNLGVVYEKLGNIEEAKNCYQDAITLDNNYTKAKNNLALLYEKTGNENDAIKLYNEALAIDSNYAVALKNIGRVYKNTGKYIEAENVYEKLIGMEGDDADLLFQLAKVEEKLNVTHAVEIYKKCIKLDPSNVELRRSIATLYANNDDYENAMDELKTIESIEPANTENKMSMARLAYDNANIGDTVKILQGLLATMPDNKDALFFLGTLYLDNGESKKAAEVFERLNALDSTNPWVKYNLARAYREDKRPERAMEVIEPFLELSDGDKEKLDSDIDIFNRYFKVYEEVAGKMFRDDEVGKKYRDLLYDVNLDDYENDKEAENAGITDAEEDALLDTIDDTVPIINIGDLEPEYAVTEEDETITLDDGEEEKEKKDEELEDIKKTTMLGLLDDKEMYDDRVDQRRLSFDDEVPKKTPQKKREDEEPVAPSIPENPVPSPVSPPVYYMSMPPPPVNDERISALENKLDQFMETMRPVENEPQGKKSSLDKGQASNPDELGKYYDLLDDYKQNPNFDEALDTSITPPDEQSAENEPAAEVQAGHEEAAEDAIAHEVLDDIQQAGVENGEPFDDFLGQMPLLDEGDDNFDIFQEEDFFPDDEDDAQLLEPEEEGGDEAALSADGDKADTEAFEPVRSVDESIVPDDRAELDEVSVPEESDASAEIFSLPQENEEMAEEIPEPQQEKGESGVSVIEEEEDFDEYSIPSESENDIIDLPAEEKHLPVAEVEPLDKNKIVPAPTIEQKVEIETLPTTNQAEETAIDEEYNDNQIIEELDQELDRLAHAFEEILGREDSVESDLPLVEKLPFNSDIVDKSVITTKSERVTVTTRVINGVEIDFFV